MGTFLVLDIPKVPSDSTIWELRKSIFGIFGIKNLSRLDSRDMWVLNSTSRIFTKLSHCDLEYETRCNLRLCPNECFRSLKLFFEWSRPKAKYYTELFYIIWKFKSYRRSNLMTYHDTIKYFFKIREGFSVDTIIHKTAKK